MIELLTFFVAGPGSAILGGFVKMVAGRWAARERDKEQSHQQELAKISAMSKEAIDWQGAVFGPPEITTFAKGTRRILAVGGMLTFGFIAVWATIYSTQELTTIQFPAVTKDREFLWGLWVVSKRDTLIVSVTLGHILISQVATLSAIFGFYFTPGGNK